MQTTGGITAGSIMDDSAALLNDVNKTYFSYAVMLPYLKIAYNEMIEECQNNNIPIANEQSKSVIIQAGIKSWGGTEPGQPVNVSGTLIFESGPPLPQDLIVPQKLLERLAGSAEDFQEMTRVEFLPPYVQLVEALIFWSFNNQQIQFLGATQNREVMMNYIGNTALLILDQNSVIPMFNSRTTLAFRTAGLVAQYIGENEDRAGVLNGDASNALDRMLGINTKNRQTQTTRRRPFMARFKIRGY
jgi:hypothetical protein